jgi:hypothetical protein
MASFRIIECPHSEQGAITPTSGMFHEFFGCPGLYHGRWAINQPHRQLEESPARIPALQLAQ